MEPELEQRMVCNDNNDDDLDMDTVLPHHILQHIVKLLTDKFTQVSLLSSQFSHNDGNDAQITCSFICMFVLLQLQLSLRW